MINRQIYILDRYLQPVPIGATGEIYIGGPALALGYLNNPELTAEKFIADPFREDPGSRLYRTGDLGRYRADGNIEFLGRFDGQVKIRGYRVEVGEVENQLLSHPDIHAAVVLAREDISDHTQLVAYVVPRTASISGGAKSNGDHRPVDSEISRVELWPSVGEYPIYDELLYHAMTSDQARLARYKTAIEKFVKDRTVLDVGTGKDAILARICAEAGAKKIYAVEVMDGSYEHAKTLVQNLGLENRIQLIKGELTTIALPEKVDVCVSEILGTIGGSEGAAVVLNEARRFLNNDGVMIPKSCITKIAAMTLPDELHQRPAFAELPGFYAENILEYVGHKFDFRVCVKNFPQSKLLSDVAIFESLNFHEWVSPQFTNKVVLKITRGGRLDGFLLWVTVETAEGIFLETMQEQSHWLPVFFPVFYPGIEVVEDDRIETTCSGTISDNGINPDYRVIGRILRQNGASIKFDFFAPHHRQVDPQTEFYRRLFDNGKLARVELVASKIIEADLVCYLRTRLPDYMIPSAIMIAEDLPITVNGKINRNALPKPKRNRVELDKPFVEPRTPTERALAQIWEEVLKTGKIGLHDNFFDLGGNSLLAVRLTTTIRRKFNTTSRVANVFEAPTVEQFARLLQGPPESSCRSLVALNRQGSRRPFFWVHGEASDACLPRYLGLDQPLYGLRHQSEDGQAARYKTVEDIATHYLEEIRLVQPEGPYLLGGYCFGGLVTFEMAKRLQAQGEKIDLLVLLDPSFEQSPDWDSTSPQTPTPSLLNRLRRHRHTLASLRLQEKWRYVPQRAKRKVADTVLNAFTPVKKITQKVTWEICTRLGVAIPVSMRSPYILDIYEKAISSYAPQPYRGNSLLIVTDDYPQNLRSKWFDQSSATLAVHETAGNHTTVLEEPNVGFWAKKLKSCFDAAQNCPAGMPVESLSHKIQSFLFLHLLDGTEQFLGSLVEAVAVGQIPLFIL